MSRQHGDADSRPVHYEQWMHGMDLRKRERNGIDDGDDISQAGASKAA
jgi:hypothetical protein